MTPSPLVTSTLSPNSTFRTTDSANCKVIREEEAEAVRISLQHEPQILALVAASWQMPCSGPVIRKQGHLVAASESSINTTIPVKRCESLPFPSLSALQIKIFYAIALSEERGRGTNPCQISHSWSSVSDPAVTFMTV